MMQEEQRWTGVFWVPGNEGLQVPGILTFHPVGGAELELIGALSVHAIAQRATEEPVILGAGSGGGTRLTLVHCLLTSTTLGSGFPTTKYYVGRIIAGAHFATRESIRFRTLAAQFIGLYEWAGLTGLRQELVTETESGKLQGVALHYEPCEPVTAIIRSADDLVVEVRVDAALKTGPDAGVRQVASLCLVDESGRHLDDLLGALWHISNFLCLGVAQPLLLTSLIGECEEMKIEAHGTMHYMPVSVLFSVAQRASSEPASRHEMMFTLTAVGERFDAFLNDWFSKRDVLEPVYELYFGSVNNPPVYLHSQFLAYVQALESYHRRVVGGYERPIEEHEERIAMILESVPKHRAWLKGKLRFSNEITLARRVSELVAAHEAATSLFIDNAKSRFAERVAEIRNYHTHYDARLRPKRPGLLELHDIVRKCKLLLELCLLREIGFDSHEITQFARRSLSGGIVASTEDQPPSPQSAAGPAESDESGPPD